MNKGMMAGADPTAPGGMSEAALVVELVETHGWKMREAKALKWPEKIDAVCEARRAAELVAEVHEHGTGVLEPDEPDEADDIDTLLAELDEAMADAAPELAAAAPPEPVCGCGTPESQHFMVDPPHAFIDSSYYPSDEEHAEMFPQPDPLFIGMPGTKDYIFDGHSGTGPSAAERWIACTASLGATRAFLETLTPRQQVAFAQANMAARQGTTAHSAAEVEARVLLGEVSATEAEQSLLELAIEPDTGDEAYNDEMAEYITEYTDLIQSYIDSHGAENVLIEQRVEAVVELLTATNGEPDTYTLRGSLDLGVLPFPTQPRLVVGDLKYGEGIDVDVDSNPQIRIYALGLLALIVERYGELPDWLTDVDYHIIQPRLGGIKTWSESVDELLDWRDEALSKALTEALGGIKAGAAFNPGPIQCQWCPARGSCPALAASRMDSAAELFDVIVTSEFEDGPGAFPETESLSNVQLGALYEQIRGLTDIAKSLKEEAERRLYRGEQVPGFHLVNYSPPRKWKDTDAAEEAVSAMEGIDWEALFQRKLITPTAAEKLLGDEDYTAKIAPLVDKPPKRPVIAPEGDRRTPWTGRPPEAMFDIEDDEG